MDGQFQLYIKGLVNVHIKLENHGNSLIVHASNMTTLYMSFDAQPTEEARSPLAFSHGVQLEAATK